MILSQEDEVIGHRQPDYQKYTDLQQKILYYLEQNKDGLHDADLSKMLQVSENNKIEALNTLLDHRRIIMLEREDKSLVYRYQSEDNALKFRDMEAEDTLIYQIISESNSKGVWLNELKKKSNMTSVQINKILKKLEKKGLIKSVKSIQAKNRKVWMLIEMEPSTEVTGGIWYPGQEFDKDFIEVLYKKCHEYIIQQEIASLKEVAMYVRSLGILNIEIKDDDIQTIVNTLLYDDKIEEVNKEYSVRKNAENDGDMRNVYYKAAHWYSPNVAYTQIPCAHCPVFDDCKPGNIINPNTCKYLDEWFCI